MASRGGAKRAPDFLTPHLRGVDWNATPVGAPEAWSASLRMAVQVLLASPAPMFLWWGGDFTVLYNEAFATLLGSRHPEALGRSAREVWRAIWNEAGPPAEMAFRDGIATCYQGFPSFTYTPVTGADGEVEALLGTCANTSLTSDALRAFVHATSDAVYWMNADWSQAYDVFGSGFLSSTGGPSGNWLETYVPAEDQSFVMAEVQRAIATGSVFEMEHRVIRHDGSTGWTFSRAIPVFDAQGRVEQWIGTARDITEGRETETRLAGLRLAADQQRRLYEAILSTTPDLVYVFDLNHRFTYVNRALLNMWGKTFEEAIGRTCLELGYEPWHAEMHNREIDTVAATRGPIRGEVPFTGTGGRRIYDYIFVPVFGPDGSVEAVAGTTRDVTDRKSAEERVRESEERLRFMAESMPQKIYTARADGEIDYFNRQWMEYTGLEFEDLRGFKWLRVVHPEDAGAHMEQWRKSMASGEPFESTQRIRGAGGAYRWHLSRAQAMRGPDGGITMWIGSSTDIEEQKMTEEALLRANEDLEQFAYTATHDLQEPLRSVIIYSELLTRRHAEKLDGAALQYLEFLRGGALRMEMLVRDLLEFTRAGRIDGTAAGAEDANRRLAAAIANLETAIAESGAEIEAQPLPTLPVLGTHLQQLFQNLIGNAIKYRDAERAPRVKIAAEKRGDRWLFSISDNGIGIEAEYKERIFGLFKRLHTGDKYTGTGIGLAICQRIVERYHGSIWVESEPGRGSHFQFTLPA